MKFNTFYEGDIFDFFDEINDNSVDLIIADPPYNQNIDYWDEFEDEEEYFEFTYKWLDKAVDKLKTTGSLYVFNNAYNSAYILTYLVSKGLIFKNSIIWYKKDGFSGTKSRYVNNQETILYFTKTNDYTFNAEEIRVPYLSSKRIESAKKKGIVKNGKRWYPNPNGKLCTDVWEIPSVRLSKKVKGKTVKTKHPTPKPKDMIERMIKASSNEDDLVLDLFSGSGITTFLCIENNRNYMSCEKDKDYSRIIKDKIRELKSDEKQ